MSNKEETNLEKEVKNNSATIEKKGMSKFTTAKLDEFIIFSLNIFNSLLLFIFCLNLNLIKFLTKFFSSINFL